MSDDLLKLAERCEAATGPDRWLDGDIWIALGLAPAENESGGVWGFERARYNDDGGEWRASEFNQPAPDKVRRAPAYTASIDAAMSLVPEGNISGEGPWLPCLDSCQRSQTQIEWEATIAHNVFDAHVAYAPTAALALCAAALRARSAA